MSSTTKPKKSRPVGRPRNDGKPHLSRRRVFQVCSKLIAEHGYGGTGIRMMATALDASPASLFNLFGSKDGLLVELISYAAQPSLAFYRKMADIDADPVTKLYKSVYEEVIVVASADQDYAALFYLPELRKPELKPAQGVRQDMISHYQTLIIEGERSGRLVVPHAALAAEQVFQLTETFILGSSAVTRQPPARLAKRTADFALRGLLKDPGELEDLARQARQIPLSIDLSRAV